MMTLAGRIREAFRGLSDGKRPVTYRQLFDALGVASQAEKTKVRTACRDFLNRGEIIRVGRGVFEYRGKAPRATAPLIKKMWRLIRMKVRFKPRELVQLTGADPSHVYKYMKFLQGLGLVSRHGREGQEHIYRLTLAGRERIETPYPSRDYKDRWRITKDAGWRLIRILVEEDLNKPKVRERALGELVLVEKGLTEG